MTNAKNALVQRLVEKNFTCCSPNSTNIFPLLDLDMKISLLTSTLVGFLFISSCAAISENQVRILLNNGVAAPGMSCSAGDMVMVLKSLLFTRRNLRQGNNKVEEPQSNDEADSTGSGRKLPVTLYPASCRTTCQGFATGTCVAPACKGYRREMEETVKEELTKEDRDLLVFDFFWCEAAKANVQTYLSLLSVGGLVSPSCMKLLQAPRKVDCIRVVC